MKNKIVVGICLVLISAMTTFVLLAHNDAQAAALAQQRQELIELQQKRDALQQRVDIEKARLKAECDKSHAYYDSLTLLEQEELGAPNCYLEVLE